MKSVSGSKHGKWTGGSKSTDAYQSRKAYEGYHGTIPQGYLVHHKDGNPQNRSRENLKIVSLGTHNRIEKKGKKISEFGKGHKNKPNIGTEDGPQRRFRK